MKRGVPTKESSQSHSRTPKRHVSIKNDAIQFLNWCRFALNPLVGELNASDKSEFETGKIPKRLLNKVRTAWSRKLMHSHPPEGSCAVAATVLKTPEDLAAWMNCLYGQEHELPKRIQTPVFDALKDRAKEIHDEFFASNGNARLIDYLQVWQSHRRAHHKLIIQANGWTQKPQGGASFGGIPMDVERMYLSDVEATGTVTHRPGLLSFLQALSEKNDPNAEVRLKRFLIKLGRALASTKKRRSLPDWVNGVDQTERFIVEGWCESITVDKESWPPLCLLTTSALVKFLRLCDVKHCRLARKDPRTIERALQRLGLIRIPFGRFKHVKKRNGRFSFT